MEQRTVTTAATETETGGSDSAIETPEIAAVETPEIATVETPEIAAGENLTKKSEGKWNIETLKSLSFIFYFFILFLFTLIVKGWVEFGYIIFGLNGAQWIFS